MNVLTKDGETIIALPGAAKCSITGKNPLEMNFCPRRDLDESCDCVPDLCDAYRDGGPSPDPDEKKAKICLLLCFLLQQTRGAANVERLIYLEESEQVKILYTGGNEACVNVACDSGLGIIKDVVDYICRH